MTAGFEDREDGVAALPDGGSLAYQIHGRAHAGTPLLLIRPLGGSTALWGVFRTRLAQSLRVVSFDLRGTGHSSADPAWVSSKGLARDSLHLLDQLAIERAHVFGISLGGMAASWLAALAPGRVAKLCLASAPKRGLEWTRAGLLRTLGLAACFARPRADVEAALVDRILSREFRAANPETVHAIEHIVRAHPSAQSALLKHALAGLLHDASGALQGIRAPTLVLAGQRDRLLGIEPARTLADAIPHASFEVIAAAGHDLTLEQPIVTASRLAEFIAT
jgi:3-oxoadipate enol-lactonase